MSRLGPFVVLRMLSVSTRPNSSHFFSSSRWSRPSRIPPSYSVFALLKGSLFTFVYDNDNDDHSSERAPREAYKDIVGTFFPFSCRGGLCMANFVGSVLTTQYPEHLRIKFRTLRTFSNSVLWIPSRTHGPTTYATRKRTLSWPQLSHQTHSLTSNTLALQ